MTAPMQIERLTRYGDPPPAAPPLPWMRWSDHEGLWIETVEHLQARIDERVKGMDPAPTAISVGMKTRNQMKINRHALRMMLAGCKRFTPLLEDFTVLEVAEHPIMPVDEWTEDECLEAVEWASDKGSDRTPSAITRHLDAIRRDR